MELAPRLVALEVYVPEEEVKMLLGVPWAGKERLLPQSEEVGQLGVALAFVPCDRMIYGKQTMQGKLWSWVLAGLCLTD